MKNQQVNILGEKGILNYSNSIGKTENIHLINENIVDSVDVISKDVSSIISFYRDKEFYNDDINNLLGEGLDNVIQKFQKIHKLDKSLFDQVLELFIQFIPDVAINEETKGLSNKIRKSLFQEGNFDEIRRLFIYKFTTLKSLIKLNNEGLDDENISKEIQDLAKMTQIAKVIMRFTLKKIDVIDNKSDDLKLGDKYAVGIRGFTSIITRIYTIVAALVKGKGFDNDLSKFGEHLGSTISSNLHNHNYDKTLGADDIRGQYSNQIQDLESFYNDHRSNEWMIFEKNIFKAKICLNFSKHMIKKGYELTPEELLNKENNKGYLISQYLQNIGMSSSNQENGKQINDIIIDLTDRIIADKQDNLAHLMNLVFYLLSYKDSIDLSLLNKLVHEIRERKIYGDDDFGMELEGYRIDAMRDAIKSYQAEFDALTGLNNRGQFDLKLEEAFLQSKRKPDTVQGLILIDIDDFKGVNDTGGHPFGDAILCALADVIKKTLREVDFSARYGGEEFAVIIECRNEEGLVYVAEKLRCAVYQEVCNHKIVQAALPLAQIGLNFDYITVSMGVTKILAQNENGEEKDCCMILSEADKALYESKEKGKNQVTTYK